MTSLTNCWNEADTPLRSVHHVSQVHKFSRTKRVLEVLIDEQNVRSTQKGKPPKTYSAGAFVNIELTSGAGITVRIHEKNQKRPKKYVFDSPRSRDRFVSLVRGLQRNKAPPQNWFSYFDKDKDGIISVRDLTQTIAERSKEEQHHLCRGQTPEETAKIMVDWCECNGERPIWAGLDFHEFVRFVVFIAKDFTIEQFFSSWCEVSLRTSTEITRTLARANSVSSHNYLPGEHTWNETPHVSWIFNSENMGLTTIRGVLVATNYRLIFSAYREEGSNSQRNVLLENNNKITTSSGEIKDGSSDKGANAVENGGNGGNGSNGEGNSMSESEMKDNGGNSTSNSTAKKSTKISTPKPSVRNKGRGMTRRRASLIVRDIVKKDKYQKEVGKARLMFVDRVMQVPLLTINAIKQSKRGGSIKIQCKDIRDIKFAFDSSAKWVTSFVSMLEGKVFPTSFEGNFEEKNGKIGGETKNGGDNAINSSSVDDGGDYYAACYHRALKKSSTEALINGWNLYDPISEYERLGIIPKGK
jgi:hypothetical protein